MWMPGQEEGDKGDNGHDDGDKDVEARKPVFGTSVRSVSHVPGARGVVVVLAVLPLVSCSLFEPDPVAARFQSMGTEGTLTVAARDADRLPEAERTVQAVMTRLERELSVYRPDSAVSRLNERAGIEPLEVPPDTLRLLELSKHFGDLTGGAFDVTVGPALGLWRSGAGGLSALPSEQAIGERLALVDYRAIAIDHNRAFLPRRGMSVDLGGIGKGYAVDAAWEACRSLGLSRFMIDLGGNLRASGQPTKDAGWHVAIRNPFDRSASAARLEIPPGWAVATSGQYERFVEIQGRRYGHIIDPRSGYPASGLASVTILAADATTADALSTSLFVLGPKAGAPVLKKMKAAAMLIPEKDPLELWVTPGFEKRLLGSAGLVVRRLPGW
jgi:thiamine biosynthesis lipoprotein